MIWIFRVTEFEVDESQTHSVFQKCGVTSSTRKRKQARTQRQSSRCPRGRQSKHFLKNKEYSSTSARRNAIARKVDVAWPTGQLLHLSVKKKARQRWKIGVDVNPPWPVECTAAHSHQDNGELLEEKRTVSCWIQRTGAFLPQPRELCEQHPVVCGENHVIKEDKRSSQCLRQSEGVEVAEKGHFFKAPQENYRAVRNPIEYMGFWRAQAEVHEWTPGLGRQDLGGGK